MPLARRTLVRRLGRETGKAVGMNIRRLVLHVDRAQPRPSLIEMGRAISEQSRIEGFNITVTDIDVELEIAGLDVTIEGTDLDYDGIETAIRKVGAAIHSVDELAAGDRIVPHVPGVRS
jgi:hypothetical protein